MIDRLMAWLDGNRRAEGDGDGPALPRPERPICLIGDIHGRLDLLRDLDRQIAAQPDAGAARVIVLGDMIDRGPDSAGVIAFLRDRMSANGSGNIGEWTCLMGNHERMLLDFLADPREDRRWLRFGGDTTLRSYGVTTNPDRPRTAAAELASRMAEGDLDCLRGLPTIWCEDGLAAVHAAADPRRSLDDQDETALLWGHPDFGRRPRSDGIWIARGHEIQDQPSAEYGVISVDTGAWKTGRLTAAWLDRNGLRFIATI